MSAGDLRCLRGVGQETGSPGAGGGDKLLPQFRWCQWDYKEGAKGAQPRLDLQSA